MKSQQKAASPRILLVVLTFVLLCAVVLLASLKSTAGSSLHEKKQGTLCSSEPARRALEDAALADLALREKNFGAAQLHIQRARVRLEAAVAESNNSLE